MAQTTQVFTRGWSNGAKSDSVSIPIVVAEEVVLDEVVPPSSTNVEYDLEVLTAQIKTIFIKASAACTIKTNSSGSPDDTITVPPNFPIGWTYLDGVTIPLPHNITKIYVTSSAGCNLEIYLGINPAA